MYRRRFLRTAALAASAAYAVTPEEALRLPGTKTIDISIFMTDTVQDAATSDDPYFPTKTIGTAVENALTDLAEDTSTEITVKTETTVIPSDDLTLNGDDPVHSWEHEMKELVPVEELASDTNLLLAADDIDIAGQAQIPCQNGCDGADHTAAVVTDVASIIDDLDMGDVTGPWDYTTAEYLFPVALHEVGHTLGLEHEHGTATDDDPLTVTPMLGTYILTDEYAGERNHFNDRLPDDPEENEIYATSTFNSELTIDDLILSE